MPHIKSLGEILEVMGLRGSPLDRLAASSLETQPPAAQAVAGIAQPAVHHTRLPNGVRVVSEEPRFPGLATMGVIADYGTRDETAASSGVLHAMSLTRYKSMLNTVDTVNYGMVQMSGGEYRMGFDREKTWYKFQCLPHDAVDLFGMMIDCAFEPRNHVTCNNAISRLTHSHRLLESANAHHQFTDTVLASVFGAKGLGNPLLGREGNAMQLNSHTVQGFQLENTAPEGITVVGLNVESHLEFEELVASKLGGLVGQRARQRPTQSFTPCFLLSPKKANHTELAVLWPTSAWGDDRLHLNHILVAALGRAESGYSDATGQSLNRGLLAREAFDRNALFRSLEAFNMHFSDAGLFGLRANVAPGRENEALDFLAKTLPAVLNPQLFEAAKEHVLTQAAVNLAQDFARVEEYMKEACVLGRVAASELLRKVREASFDDFVGFCSSTFSTEPALIAQGPDVAQLMPQGEFLRLFK